MKLNLGSTLGLGRKMSKWIGMIVIGFGFLLATPPGMILPDDFLNIIIAGFLTKIFLISMPFALLLTYTAVAWTIILLGASIYPYNTIRLLHGIFGRFIKCFKLIISSPIHFVLFVISLIIIYYISAWYMHYLTGVLL